MSSLFSLVKDRINFWLILPVLILLGILSSMLWIDLDAFLPVAISKNLLNLPQPKATIILLSLFLAISLCYLLLFVTYIRKPKLKDYELITPPGFYKHKKTGGYYCQKCLLKDHIAVPLYPSTIDEFRCRLCDQSYKFDYNVLICNSYLSIKAKEHFNNHDKAANEFIDNNKCYSDNQINHKPLDDVAVKILLFLWKQKDRITSEEISQTLSLDIQVVKFHLEELEKSKKVHGVIYVGVPRDWIIIQAGRRYLIENKLISYIPLQSDMKEELDEPFDPLGR